jgi:2',3'-cyclic-nucleotide 2'-phosphodiesterase (5'-nucleotidase family)
MGGFARRASLIDSFRTDPAPVILCSAGDFYGESDVYSELKSHFVAEMMGELGYEAVAVGERELNYGLKKLLEDGRKYRLPLLCANLFLRTREGRPGRRPFAAYRIVERGGLKVGFVALLSPKTRLGRATTVPDTLKAMTYMIVDPVRVAREVVPAVRKKCDLLVLLAHMDKRELEKLLAEVPGVDLAVLGHFGSGVESTREPYLLSGVPTYAAVPKGQRIGRLRLTRLPDGQWKRENTIYVLDKKVPDHERFAARIREFEKEYKKKTKEIFVRRQFRRVSRSAQTQETYVGMGMCARCHREIFEAYVNTAHARAYETLSAEMRHRDVDCLPCHTTGYGRPGGFTGFRSKGGMTDLVEVQCEACHGPGAEHERTGKYASRALESCQRCHTAEHDPEFDFSEDWPKIAH